MDQERLEEWAGPHNHANRRKTMPIVNHPDRIFAMIKPGHSGMHVREGQVRERGGTIHLVRISPPMTGRIHSDAHPPNASIPCAQSK